MLFRSQGAATQEIAGNVQRAAAGTSEVATNVSTIAQAANDAGTASAMVLTAANELAKQSEDLSGRVDSFITAIRAA